MRYSSDQKRDFLRYLIELALHCIDHESDSPEVPHLPPSLLLVCSVLSIISLYLLFYPPTLSALSTCSMANTLPMASQSSATMFIQYFRILHSAQVSCTAELIVFSRHTPFLGSPGGSGGLRIHLPLPEKQETVILFLFREDTLEQEMSTLPQYSCLGNPMDREPQQPLVTGVTENWT